VCTAYFLLGYDLDYSLLPLLLEADVLALARTPLCVCIRKTERRQCQVFCTVSISI